MAQPVDPLSQGGGASEGGIGFPPKNAAPRPPVRSRTFGRIYDQLQHAPPTLHGGHHVCAAMQCSAIIQPPDDWPCRRYMRPTTARRTHTPRVDQQAGTSGPIPVGSTGAVMKDRSAHGGGSPEAPEDESPIA